MENDGRIMMALFIIGLFVGITFVMVNFNESALTINNVSYYPIKDINHNSKEMNETIVVLTKNNGSEAAESYCNDDGSFCFSIA